MKIEKCSIKNFMAISEAELKLSDKGLVLIQGENQDDKSADSNGSGKSSIADAICWCLYNKTARGETGDGVVNRFVEKDCSVELVIKDDTQEYLITRYRKDSKKNNSITIVQNGKDVSQGTEKLNQQEIEKIIGCSYEVFKASIYSGQENMPDLPSMTDKSLKVLIEEASGVNILEESYFNAKVLRNDKESVVKTLGFELANKERWLSEIKDRLANMMASYLDFESNRGNKKTAFVNAADVYRDKRKALLDMKSGISIADFKKTLLEIENRIAQLAALSKETNDKEFAFKVNIQAFMLKKSNLDSLEDELKNINAKIGTPCKECGKPISAEDIDDVKNNLKDKIAVLEKEVLDLNSEKIRLQNMFEYARDALANFIRVHGRAYDLDENRKGIEKSIFEYEKIDDNINILDDLIKTNTKHADNCDTEENPHSKFIENDKQEIAEIELDLIEYEDNLKNAKRELELANKVVDIFSPKGVRAIILDSVTPFLNERTEYYLSTLSDNNIQANWTTLSTNSKGELMEKFNIEVKTTSGGERFSSISGGEKKKVKIATALALQDLIAKRATKSINLFIGDEIDSALDESGLERLMVILEERAKSKGSVFIISHNDLKDWIDNVLLVTKKDKKATIEEISL